jgi:DNA adenine methylase
MKKQNSLRTPISYYGGKQKLASTIVSFIPNHKLYCEPFVGGAAIYFAKQPSKVEVINDTNSELINFYKVVRNRYHELISLIRVTLHSRLQHDDAWVIYNKPHLHDEVRRAWAVWVLSTQSFSAMLDGSWGYDKESNTTTKKITNKREQFTEELALRLHNTQIECADALYIIDRCDGPETFIYADPPYYNSNCGHYDGYSIEDYEMLLKRLEVLKGKFILSSYHSKLLDGYVKKNQWQQWDIEQQVSVNAKSGYRKRKVEVLTANFELNVN